MVQELDNQKNTFSTSILITCCVLLTLVAVYFGITVAGQDVSWAGLNHHVFKLVLNTCS